MSLELTQALKDLYMDRQLEASTQGTSKIPQWVFCDERGQLLHHNTLRKVFHRLLQAAGLRQVRFHDLRHTFASLLLQQGESLVYVKEQMGHSSIQVTVDLYGHLIPGSNKQAVDKLDAPVKTALTEVESAPQADPLPWKRVPMIPQVFDSKETAEKEFGVSDGFRTRNLWSHSPAL